MPEIIRNPWILRAGTLENNQEFFKIQCQALKTIWNYWKSTWNSQKSLEIQGRLPWKSSEFLENPRPESSQITRNPWKCEAGPLQIIINLGKSIGPNYVRLRMKPNKRNRLKRTSQIWRPSEIPADTRPQMLVFRIYVEIDMQPKLCRPSREAQRTTSFETYLPNLTAFRNSSRRWITDLVFKDVARKTICGPNYVSPNKFV